MRKLVLRILVAVILPSVLIRCGVKGDPVPPATPAEIGVGKPVYQLPPESKPTSLKPSTMDQEDDGQEE